MTAKPSLPQFITFTGVDAFTSIEGMKDLSSQYPIEWAVLFSPKREGQGRFNLALCRQVCEPVYGVKAR